MFVRLNPLFHYNDSERLDPYIYRCYPSRFFIDSSKAMVFAGVYTSRTDEELFEQAEVEPFEEPSSSNSNDWLQYKHNILNMMLKLMENKKVTFIKDIQFMLDEPTLGEKEQFLNYFSMHDRTIEKEVIKRTAKLRDELKKEKEEKMKKTNGV